MIKMLILEDSESDADLLMRFLKKENIICSYTRVWSKESFINALHKGIYDVVIADHSLPNFSGMEAFRILKNTNNTIPFILVTGTLTEQALTEYAKEGIDDYILKNNLLRLPSAIEHVLSKKKIVQLQTTLECTLKDLTDSIYYAKTIQNAMMPDSVLLYNSFPESFILFKPKDILSGDFYWFKSIENTFYMAAADCTGHGIPGALLSMIGIEKLNRIVQINKNTSEILEQLKTSFEIDLCESTKREYSNDGMDIALCAINKNSNTISFAGANRPLWFIRKGQSEIEEIKGTKRAIGGLNTSINLNYSNNSITCKQGDTFYIFSDGFADQFGGENNKKVTSKKLKQLLVSIQGDSMKEQEIKLSNFIKTWKSKTEQTDDILVIGIRII